MENLKANMEYPIMFMDLKLGSRTYAGSEDGLDDLNRPDLLAKLQAALPNAVKPEYTEKFTRKMFADIRASESSTGALSFRIGVSINLVRFFRFFELNFRIFTLFYFSHNFSSPNAFFCFSFKHLSWFFILLAFRSNFHNFLFESQKTIGKWADQNSQPANVIEDSLLWQAKTDEQIVSAFEIYTEKNAQIIVSHFKISAY